MKLKSFKYEIGDCVEGTLRIPIGVSGSKCEPIQVKGEISGKFRSATLGDPHYDVKLSSGRTYIFTEQGLKKLSALETLVIKTNDVQNRRVS